MSTLSKELEEFIDSHSFRHFKGRELTAYWSRKSGKATNSCPPKNLWNFFIPTLRVLDELRQRWGHPIILLSTFRNVDYNRAVGGAVASQHLKFNAIDFRSTVGTPDQWAAILQQMRDKEQKFKGGLHAYPDKGFVHVDTRGHNVNW